MSVISRLKVWLTADTKEFEDRLKKSKDNVGGLSSSLNKLKGFLGKAFAAVGVASLGRKLVDLGMQVDRVNDKVEQLTGIDDFKLSGEIKALSDVFEKDYTSVLRTANTLHKQLGVGFEEAMSIIKDGLAAGLDVNGDFLEQLSEYAPQFRSAGLSAREMLSILQQSVKDGVFSDKGLDAIKEAMLRIREMPKATREALEGIGLSSVEVERGLVDGSLTIFEVIKQVSERLNELPENAAVVGTAIADIFGGPGEDAGLSYLKTLKDIDLQHKVVATEIGQAQGELASALTELNTVASRTFDGINESLLRLKIVGAKVLTSILDISPARQRFEEDIDKAIKKGNELFKKQAPINVDTSSLGGGKAELTEEERVLRMSQDSVKALKARIAAYAKLLESVRLVDEKQAIVYTREINRMEALIAKNEELVNAKLRTEIDVPVMASQSSIGVEGALLDNTTNFASFEEIIKLPEYLKASSDELQPIVREMIDMSGVINGAFSDMATGIGESVGQLISSGGDLSGFASLVGTTFADMAIQVGKIAIETGTAVLGIKAALKSLTPWAAIAAGVALVALGTAVKGALGNIADGGGNTFSSNTYSNNLDVRTQSGSLDRVSQSVNVEVSGEFKLQGNTLVAAINKNLTT